ncbi:NUMOD4 motif protein [compost metagenome]
MEKEIWEEIEDTNGNYSVSNLGRVRTNKHYVNHHTGSRVVNERIRPLQKHNQGYSIVTIGIKGSKLVHRLVASAFIQNPNNLEFVNHKDGVKTNNHVDNLEWRTRQYNEDHAFSTGLKNSTGSSNQMAKLVEDNIIEIRQNKLGLSTKNYSDKFNVDVATINRIKKGVIWKHVKI